MSSTRLWIPCLAVAFAAATGLVAVAIEPAPTALTHASQLRAQRDVPLEIAPAVDLAAVTVEDADRQALGLPPRFAIVNPVRIAPGGFGLWERVDGDTLVWRLRIAAAGAPHLNLGFTRYHMPPGGRLFVYAADLATWIRPFTDADNARHGELWTPVLRSDELVIEVTLPEAVRDELRLELGSINVGYRGFGAGKTGGVDSGPCNVDVVCPQGDAWRDEIPAVAVISIGGGLNCSGFMVNNTAQDQTPYFMTAYHCGLRSSNAASLVTYWNYETSTCGGVPDGTLDQFTSGSTFRAQYSTSDFTLVELSSDPDPSYGVTFAGWDHSGVDATSAVAIHHPSVDEKRISFENDPTTTTSYLGRTPPGDGTHVRVADWDEGTTEGGSSGSPLFDQDHQVIGQLHGGYAACGNDLDDWYGKFSVSWTGGGTSSTRLSNWLDPLGTGQDSLGTLNPYNACGGDPDCDDGLFCNGQETCVGSQCQPGSDPCPGELCNETTDLCEPIVCDNDGVCESGEDCNNCSGDCIGGTTSVSCGNGVCEAGAGEDCVSCPQDCNGNQNGKPSSRFCCGDGDGQNPVDCSYVLCDAGAFSCTNGGAGVSYCCGDGVCEGEENLSNCQIDCGSASCGDGVCNGGAGEDVCSCPADCGSPAASEVGLCSNGVDDDCDGPADCADGDCAGDPVCACLPLGDICTVDADCCSGKCRGPSGRKTCK